MATFVNLKTSPAGKAQWPRLITPDTKFDEAGIYSVALVIPGKKAKPYIDKIDELMEQSLKEALAEGDLKRKKQAEPPYYEDDEGNVVIKFKMKAKTAKGNKRTVKFFDAKGRKITDLEPIANMGNDTVMRINATAQLWATAALGAGVTLQPQEVQIIELVEYGGGEQGFEETEGSFEYSAEESSSFDAAVEDDDEEF